ncbi:1623_t:CDS:1, partial [Racocetra fulgida]
SLGQVCPLYLTYNILFNDNFQKDLMYIISDHSAFTTHCFSCQMPFPTQPQVMIGRSSNITSIDSSGRYNCPKCKKHFCI